MRPETRVPETDAPATCPHCGRPFTGERLRDIHVGEAHPDALTDVEREAHAAAVDAEGDDLFVYHLKVVGALVAVYAGLVLVYMVVLST
ncbi:MAG: hypothetical protein ABEJ30_09850 [Halorientalis sp.]